MNSTLELFKQLGEKAEELDVADRVVFGYQLRRDRRGPGYSKVGIYMEGKPDANRYALCLFDRWRLGLLDGPENCLEYTRTVLEGDFRRHWDWSVEGEVGVDLQELPGFGQ